MRGIGIEEAAAIGAELLDRDLARDRAERDRLLGAFERRDGCAGVERLRHAHGHLDQRGNHGERQQHVENRARHIDEEIAHAVRPGPREGADQRDGERNAGRGGEEVLDREPRHLAEEAHRRLAAIRLPVRVGHEADRRVEGKIGREASEAERVERQQALEAQQRVKQREAGRIEDQHRDGVAERALLTGWIDARDGVEPALDRPEEGGEEGSLACEDARHIGAERCRGQQDHGEDDGYLKPADDGHGISLGSGMGRASELLGSQQRDHEIDGEPKCDGGAEDEVQHGSGLRDEARIGDEQREAAEPQHEIEDIGHDAALLSGSG